MVRRDIHGTDPLGQGDLVQAAASLDEFEDDACREGGMHQSVPGESGGVEQVLDLRVEVDDGVVVGRVGVETRGRGVQPLELLDVGDPAFDFSTHGVAVGAMLMVVEAGLDVILLMESRRGLLPFRVVDPPHHEAAIRRRPDVGSRRGDHHGEVHEVSRSSIDLHVVQVALPRHNRERNATEHLRELARPRVGRVHHEVDIDRGVVLEDQRGDLSVLVGSCILDPVVQDDPSTSLAQVVDSILVYKVVDEETIGWAPSGTLEADGLHVVEVLLDVVNAVELHVIESSFLLHGDEVAESSEVGTPILEEEVPALDERRRRSTHFVLPVLVVASGVDQPTDRGRGAELLTEACRAAAARPVAWGTGVDQSHSVACLVQLESCDGTGGACANDGDFQVVVCTPWGERFSEISHLTSPSPCGDLVSASDRCCRTSACSS